MGARLAAFNLTIGQNVLPYQDVMCLSRLRGGRNRRNFDEIYNIPSARGSHSDSSGT
jgi:hypothetical protein